MNWICTLNNTWGDVTDISAEFTMRWCVGTHDHGASGPVARERERAGGPAGANQHGRGPSSASSRRPPPFEPH